MSNHRKALAAASALAVGTALLGSTAAGTAAQAAGSDSTYLVLAPQGTSTAKAAARVAAAGGTVVANYGQIGVLVVRSTNPAFAIRRRRAPASSRSPPRPASAPPSTTRATVETVTSATLTQADR